MGDKARDLPEILRPLAGVLRQLHAASAAMRGPASIAATAAPAGAATAP